MKMPQYISTLCLYERISILQLKMLIATYQSIPFIGHSYLTMECNYGGLVTDLNDRRLLNSLLEMVYNPDSILTDK